MTDNLITLAQAREARPCAEGWARFLEALGEPAKFNPDRLFSIGDVVKANGLNDALWSLRLLPPKDAVAAVMPAVKRAAKYTGDARVHDTIAVLDRWLAGEEVDLKAARDAAEAARDAAEAAWAAAAARDAAWAAFAAWAAHRAADAAACVAEAAYRAADAARWAADAARRAADAAAERDAQMQDLLALFPPYALAEAAP